MTKLADSHVQSAQTSQTTSLAYTLREAFARYVISTNAPNIEVFSLQDTLSVPGGANATGILVNGAPQGSGLQMGATMGVLFSQTYQLPGGTNTVEMIDGMNYARTNGAGQIIGGTPNIKYRIPYGFTQSVTTPTTPAKRILLVGDSIWGLDIPASSSNPAAPYEAFSPLVRKNALASSSGTFAGASVISSQVDGGRLDDIAVDSPTITATVAKWVSQLDGTSANEVAIQLGTNDGITAAAFGTELGNLLDAFHTADATATVLIISPYTRVSPASDANNVGYRSQEVTVCAARSSYCTYRTGAGVLGSGNMAVDGVHPLLAGVVNAEADFRLGANYDTAPANDNGAPWQTWALPQEDEDAKRRRRRMLRRLRRAA